MDRAEGPTRPEHQALPPPPTPSPKDALKARVQSAWDQMTAPIQATAALAAEETQRPMPPVTLPVRLPSRNATQQFAVLSGEPSFTEFSSEVQQVLDRAQLATTLMATATSVEELAAIRDICKQELAHLIAETPNKDARPLLLRAEALCMQNVQFVQGQRSIDLLIDEKAFPHEKAVLKLFYDDESHPMDLQRSLHDPTTAHQAANILQNLSRIFQHSDFQPSIRGAIRTSENAHFNAFLKSLLDLPHATAAESQLLDLQTIAPQVENIRRANRAYFQKSGADQAFVESRLTLPSSDTTKVSPIQLLTNDQARAVLTTAELSSTSKPLLKGETYYLRVPDADNQIVAVPKEAYEFLLRLQDQASTDRADVIKRLTDNYQTHPGIVVTGRTKSAAGIMDKLGRLCQSSTAPGAKYQSLADVVDVNGIRITCDRVEQLEFVFEDLRTQGFQFLEVDNKYGNIRKNGAYKVMPLTLLDPSTGVVFELQLATRQSLTCFDLEHNVVYKKEAIGLRTTPVQQQRVFDLYRLSALVETWAVHQGRPLDLGEHVFSDDEVKKTVRDLARMPVAIRQAAAYEQHLDRTRGKKDKPQQ